MGGNGAGKSTLMKIIAGVETPDSGELTIGERAFARLNPALAHQLGIYLVPQEPMLFPNLTVRENILFVCRSGRIPTRGCRKTAAAELPDQPRCQRQHAGSGRSTDGGDPARPDARCAILILDEPTASLTPGKPRGCFARSARCRRWRRDRVYLAQTAGNPPAASHVSVMRDGAVVLSGETAATRRAADRRHDAGQPRPCAERHAKAVAGAAGQPPHPGAGFPVLRVEDLTGEGFIDLSLEIRAGEIVGLAGLVGSGRTEFAETSTACVRRAPGGSGWRTARSVATAPAPAGQRAGLSAGRPPGLRAVSRCAGALEHGDVQSAVVVAAETGSGGGGALSPGAGDQAGRWRSAVRTLSGGNQQKVLLARCLEANPLLLIVDEPTRGVDVSARADIYQLLKSVAAQNVAVLMISSDLDEFVGLADRVLVMHQGRYSGELARRRSPSIA
jgi:AI-2 transport system ATP-binding protein